NKAPDSGGQNFIQTAPESIHENISFLICIRTILPQGAFYGERSFPKNKPVYFVSSLSAAEVHNKKRANNPLLLQNVTSFRIRWTLFKWFLRHSRQSVRSDMSR
ncbi:MAG: hypothetical protein MR861_09145, partial [Clostridiales bacterium]|nr:hypothetical protein [Clostridiales bacterium]